MAGLVILRERRRPLGLAAGFTPLLGRDLAGYPGSSRAAARANSSWCGQALDRWKHTRRVLRVMTAPIFRSLRRMVPA